MRRDEIRRGRLAFVAALITAAFLVLAGRLFVIQVVGHEAYLREARRMQTASEVVPAYRGTIWSADGAILARDVLDYEIGFDPRFVPSDKLQRIVRLVCDAVGASADYRHERLLAAIAKKERGDAYLGLADGVSGALLEEIRTALERICTPEERRGFVVQVKPRRTYPRPDLASAAVGVVDAKGVGVAGIEQSMEAYLSGRAGRRGFLKDATASLRVFDLGGPEISPVRGYDVVLTIDSRLQAIVESELASRILEEKAEAGCFVLLDCRSGDVLALASWPTYDPNRFGEYPTEERNIRRPNRAVENLYEPGSVVKPFLAAYVLDEGILRREDPIASLVVPPIRWDGGTYALFGRRVVRDVSRHEDLTLERAVVYSSNISMGIVGYRMGRERLVDMLERFGFARPTGIELPAEAAGRYSSAKGWSPLYSSVSVAFGYEVMVTPMQLARAFAALVNGGYVLEPRIVKKLRRDGLEEEIPSHRVVRRAIGEETSRAMREILLKVVEEGTAQRLKIPGFRFGGKTGTADMARGGYTKSEYLASFEGFAPYEDPQVVALCMIERPRSGRIYGASVAGPAVQKTFRRMFQLDAVAAGRPGPPR
ncbi:MAG: peptidoglycan D,D-transpeptidase FtsI family protein [Planctomycetota bacterium]